MVRPLVSAFMPVYNGEKYLEASLESLLAQDYQPFEAVICNDGSTDGTAAILARFDTIQVVEQENRGRAAACNAAVAASKGTFVTSFDSDDLWPATRVSMQAGFLIEHPEIGCVLGRQEWMNPPPWLGRDAVFGDLDGVPINSAMFRRDVFESLGGFDESFKHSEDMDILIRVRENGFGVHVLPKILVHRRFHENQMTANPPTTLPILRSLREKVARERERRDER